MVSLKEFTVSSPRPLPVIVLADISGSMAEGGKLQALNAALKDMLASFSDEDDVQAQIHVAIITFGRDGARLHLPLTPAAQAQWQDMPADGRTPMGAAFEQARELVEDRTRLPGRAYRPPSCSSRMASPPMSGSPPLERLLTSERASKAERMALAIGAEAENEVLQAFVAGGGQRVFRGDEAREIRKFFRFVTLTVTRRSRAANPNAVTPTTPTDLDSLV